MRERNISGRLNPTAVKWQSNWDIVLLILLTWWVWLSRQEIWRMAMVVQRFCQTDGELIFLDWFVAVKLRAWLLYWAGVCVTTTFMHWHIDVSEMFFLVSVSHQEGKQGFYITSESFAVDFENTRGKCKLNTRNSVPYQGKKD